MKAREEDGDITKFGYNAYNVLDEIITPAGDELGFDFDLLGRLRRYDTDDRASTFAYDGTKRLGDDDAEVSQWKRYHWCQSQLLGYDDDSNTYYIVPDMEGSTKIIIDSSQGVVNRLDFDTLGNIRNQTAAPQVEMLYLDLMFITSIEGYVFRDELYDPRLGNGFIGKVSKYPIIKVKCPFIFEITVNNHIIPIIPGIPPQIYHVSQRDWDENCPDHSDGTRCCVGFYKGTCWHGTCLCFVPPKPCYPWNRFVKAYDQFMDSYMEGRE